jgi:transposase
MSACPLFFGGVPRLVVPDNLKSGVHRASFYHPENNRSYGMMASHYGVGILPARPRKPRDKAKVEAGVRLAQTYSLPEVRTSVRHRFTPMAFQQGRFADPTATRLARLDCLKPR